MGDKCTVTGCSKMTPHFSWSSVSTRSAKPRHWYLMLRRLGSVPFKSTALPSTVTINQMTAPPAGCPNRDRVEWDGRPDRDLKDAVASSQIPVHMFAGLEGKKDRKSQRLNSSQHCA